MFTNWLYERKTKMITYTTPTPLFHALKTATYMQNNARDEDDQITMDDVITLAVAEYLQKNLWTNVVEDFSVSTNIHKKEHSFRAAEKVTPMRQAR